jgi:hypothetical protein
MCLRPRLSAVVNGINLLMLCESAYNQVSIIGPTSRNDPLSPFSDLCPSPDIHLLKLLAVSPELYGPLSINKIPASRTCK